ncbi:MAG TPA: metalloregulator ArsR/SmtB family transcription factor [Planosporangium sp.]|nr:metalloregulator ArsR/SmtB family transcription factor [Planosporangium sp.]
MTDDEAVFAALADASRRHLLDRLHADNGLTLRELCSTLDMTRQAVSKHVAVLERAGLVVVLQRGRERRHYLNPAPIADLAERWIGKYERRRVTALAELKRELEEENRERPPG